MKIDINQKKISIGSQYRIFLNNKEKYYAEKELLAFFPIVNLFYQENLIETLKIIKRLSLFSIKYDIRLANERKLKFRTKSLWKSYYECIDNNDIYEVIGHRGRKYSIFKNKKQIAFWQQEAITWLSGDNYRIFANNDCNFELIIAFCLILDNANGGGNNIFTINIGHIGKEIKKFDQKWRPI